MPLEARKQDTTVSDVPIQDAVRTPITDQILCWHPSYNVYVFENRDVLLLSESQQWLLPHAQFPYLDLLNGLLSCNDIVSMFSGHNLLGGGSEFLGDRTDGSGNYASKTALFYQQVQQLKSSSILIESALAEHYIQPEFSGDGDLAVLDHSLEIQVINLSVASELGAIHSVLLDAGHSVLSTMSESLPITYVVVDDFLDPRITGLSLTGRVLIIKLTGESVWLSPWYLASHFHHFEKLQRRVLDNQPVRKSAMMKWPERIHSIPVRVDGSLSQSQRNTLKEMVVDQLSSGASNYLFVFHKATSQLEKHPINPELLMDVGIAGQVGAPVVLKSCINRFNQDGGSRSVSADETVSRLRALVSPITGIINHFREVTLGHESPVKTYRTGFFKTPAVLKPEVMEQGFVQICMGKGVEPIQSQASALCEAVERYCALYRDELPLLQKNESQLQEEGKRTVNYQQLVPYSSVQYQTFNDSNHPDSLLKQAAIPYQNQVIHWLPAWSLTREESVYVPLSQCYSGIPFEEEQYGRWHSNGCAAGNTVEEAILQGLFELIERDAVAIWWYNRLTRPAFDLSRIHPENLEKLTKTLSPTHETGHAFWVLDLTSDIGVPVMAAIGKDKQTGGFVMGFGCHLRADIAAQRALTELCQLIPIRNQNGAPFDFDAIVDGTYLHPDDAHLPPTMSSDGQDIAEDVVALVHKLSDLNMETLVFDYSRSDIPLKTVKVFVPGLCHIWPQLANERLYTVPVTMGLRSEVYSEAALNPQALYI
ncbi:YcaO-like family protein [Litoribrevibacter albus]|uniref:YcaO domain-containing protein n=1 Tax=Litoribrevibacter albus TaxID=1473156 RepID=A0AA37W765_9GAMM|nr:YcaO-like family protein [Litoribrevibacter albus]GLQ30869.1 hypothetical protein GCM10007876_13480 [Litoribrevibacter albus]